MAIYGVDISALVFVEADDELHAMDIAKNSIGEIDEFDIDYGCKTNRLRELAGGWTGDCIPYGGDGNTRLKDILPE